MSSSDDEVEAVVQLVSNYHFVDDEDEPISFSVLPIRWSEDKSSDAIKKQIFLHGTADSGLQKIYKQVTAWKLDLSYDEPEVSVLSKENNWIKLQKPRKSFEDTIRTILITVHYLHFVKRNLDSSGKSPWDHLRRVFSLYEVRPENILLHHLPFLRAAVQHDKTLAKSKFMQSFIENHKKRKAFGEDIHIGLIAKKKNSIVEDDFEDSDKDIASTNGDESDEICAICDNGGDLLCCDGICFRSFHATVDSGSDSYCDSLNLSEDQVEVIQKFVCLNCKYKQHQCFACGKLGSSDKSLDAEVFPCAFATCGHFYHPECVAKLLNTGNENEEELLKQKIAAGESFSCPVHKCLICKQDENKEVHELQFAICRRCPRAYHRKCLPRKIAFEDMVDKGIKQRAWGDLLPKRILIYCLKHKIEKNLGTPIRNHIIFPNVENKNKTHASDLQSSQGKVVAKMRSVVSEDNTKRIPVSTGKQKTHPSDFQPSHGNVVAKTRNVVSEDSPKRIPLKTAEQFTKKCAKQVSGQGFGSSKKSRIMDASRMLLKDRVKSVSTVEDSKEPLKEEKLNSVFNKSSELVKSQQQGILHNKFGRTVIDAPIKKKSSGSLPLVDAETEKRLRALMKEKASSITLEEVKRKYKVPSTHKHSKNILDKAVTQGTVEGSVEKLVGCSIRDAKDVCEPEILNQITKWKIMDKLHWYVQNGDVIADICCGANDFSCLMKQRLEETGKKCSFKNYDVVQPKNDINFEKSNWMAVHRKELPTGSQLIIGLTPPFGVKADVLNKFIDKALEFKPKLLILIVPTETERFDEKEAGYDLVWEDGETLSGESLLEYVDVNKKQMEEWNLKPPLLYLWSRPDWTAKHKAIAMKQGHVSKEQKGSNTEENHNEPENSDKLVEDHNDHTDTEDHKNDLHEQNNGAEDLEGTIAIMLKHDTTVEQSRHEDNDSREGHKGNCCEKNVSCEHPKDRGNTEVSPEGREDQGRMNSPTMQQNASRLDELNHSRSTSDTLGSQKGREDQGRMNSPTMQQNTSEQYVQLNHSSSTFDVLGSQGFALGPAHSLSQQNSSCGWLDE